MCYILALRCNNTRNLSFSVHYNYLLTLCHFQLSILHTHIYTQTPIDWKCNQTLIFWICKWLFFFFSCSFSISSTDVIFLSMKDIQLNREVLIKKYPSGGYYVSLHPTPSPAALLLRLLCLQSPGINTWCLIHIFDKWDWCIHH